MVIDYVALLKRFHEKFSHAIGDFGPEIPSDYTKTLRMRLIEEEFRELHKALAEDELPQIAKELSDLLYVVFGTAVSYGIPIDECFLAVHESNMSKSRDEDNHGKTVKGNGYIAPKMEVILQGIRKEKS